MYCRCSSALLTDATDPSNLYAPCREDGGGQVVGGDVPDTDCRLPRKDRDP